MRRIVLSICIIGITVFEGQAVATEGGGCRTLSPDNIVSCALRANPAVRREQAGVQAAEGRVLAARPWVPSNPALVLTGARRRGSAAETATGAEPTAWNWTATLSQELEIAGQRGARRDAAQAEVRAAQKSAVVTEREVAALAWLRYFEVLAGEEALDLARKLETIGARMATVSRARADQGVLSPVEADMAEATAIALTRARQSAQRELEQSRAALLSLVGGDPAAETLRIEGPLAPMGSAGRATREMLARVARTRPEVEVARAEAQTFEARSDVFRRARVPNPSVSIFAQNDGFDEKVLGVGIGIPIPIPGIGRTYAGEIAEGRALSQRAAAEADRLEREFRLEAVLAARDYESRRIELQSFSPERLVRADARLREMATEIELGRLAVRDAVLAQQTLIALLRSHLEAKRALCMASVEVVRVFGLPFDGGTK